LARVVGGGREPAALPLGLDLDQDDVVETLETEGIEKFTAAFAKLLAGLEEKRRMLDMAGARR
jgi:hypothetical protein